ncbi:MAG: EAL domain-containing protein [Cyanobacteria bacterium J06560_2]
MAFKTLQRLVYRHATSVQTHLLDRLLERRYNQARDCSLLKTILLSSATTGALLVLAQFGLFQPVEVKSFDLLTQLTTQFDSPWQPEHPHSEAPSPVVVVAITEEDIQSQKQWPFADQVFASLLAQLQQHSPDVIGLGIYRDVPHTPGTQLLAQQLNKENVVAITHLDSLGEVKVPSPLHVPENRVGFTDFVVDPDGVVRRNFMFAAVGDRQLYSFSLRLVQKFLANKGQSVDAELKALRLGEVRLPLLTETAGGYQEIDALGYQTLSRYYPPHQVAQELSVSEVLAGDFDPDWIRGKIVVIGTTAPSQKDLFYTPFSSNGHKDLVTSGVVLHAQMVRQLLGIALEDRVHLRFLPEWGEFLWVLCWGLGAGFITWRFTHPRMLVVVAIAGAAGLFCLTFALFSYALWLPLVLPMSAFGATVAGLSVYREFRKSFYDSITGLPNRALVIQDLQKLLRSSRHDSLAVILLDIDRFKVFNESFGLQVGDRLLQIMAKRIRQNLPPRTKLARIAGDEFVVLLGNITQREDVLSFAKTLGQAMAEPIELREQKLFPTVSTGIAFSHSAPTQTLALNAEDLLRDAQTAMSRAKAQGRGLHEVFVQDMRAHLSNQLELESDLREALSRQELLLYYQPLICLETMKIAGFEALIRWQHPTRGMISPVKFIPIAEDTGLIIPIGQWVLETACRQAQQWHQQFPSQIPFMSVNLSGRQFAQTDLVEQIARILKEVGFNPAALKLELTESVVMDNVEASIEVLLRLKALGLQVGIDDFGTGYSSLSYLHRFPIDTLKVDRSFVMEMALPEGTAELVKTIIALGHNLGMNVVAEGIETKAQSQSLQGLRCEYGQGYLFSRPLPSQQATDLLINMPVWDS